METDGSETMTTTEFLRSRYWTQERSCWAKRGWHVRQEQAVIIEEFMERRLGAVIPRRETNQKLLKELLVHIRAGRFSDRTPHELAFDEIHRKLEEWNQKHGRVPRARTEDREVNS